MHRPLQHQCLIYDGAPSRHLKSLAHTLGTRLKTNHRCVYLNSPAMVSGMHSQLYAVGVNVAEQISKGALILSSQRDHLVDGRFDMVKMLDLLKNSLQQALADGYQALWATGDMTWEFGGENNLDKLLEYERRLEEFMRENPALGGICQYHRNTLPPHAIATALQTHQALYINQTLSRLNPQYQFSEQPRC